MSMIRVWIWHEWWTQYISMQPPETTGVVLNWVPMEVIITWILIGISQLMIDAADLWHYWTWHLCECTKEEGTCVTSCHDCCALHAKPNNWRVDKQSGLTQNQVREIAWNAQKCNNNPQRQMSENCKSLNDHQLLKHIIRVFPTCYVEIGFPWVRPLCFSALQLSGWA